MLSIAVSFILIFIFLVFAVSNVGLAWSGILLKKDNLFEWLVPYLRRIKNKALRNLLQCHKCVSGQFALWGYGIAWAWYGWPFNPLLLFLGVAWVLSVIVVTDWMYAVLKLDLKPGVPLPTEDLKLTEQERSQPTTKGLLARYWESQEYKDITDKVKENFEKNSRSIQETTLLAKRASKNEHLVKGETIPAGKELNYFPYNPNALYRADLNIFPGGVTEELKVSSGATREELLYGEVYFEHDLKRQKLKAYLHGKNLFIPFKDTAEGVSPKGRYLNIAVPEKRSLILDFNYAYNPLCEYSDRYECPLVPPENVLTIPIEAGEKAYH